MRLGLAVALLSSSLLMYELLLTRLFAVVLFSDLAHLTLAVAMLGVGLGALVQHRRDLLPASGFRQRLAVLALLQGIATIAAVWCVVQAPMLEAAEGSSSWFTRAASRHSTLRWGWFSLMIGTVSLPPIIAGVSLAGIFAHHKRRLGTLYGADLAGAAVGALAAMPAVAWLGGPDAVFVAALSCALAALAVAPAGSLRRLSSAAAGLSAAAALYGASGPQPVLDIRSPAAWASGEVLETRWTPLTRLVAYREGDRELILLDNASLSEPVRDRATLDAMIQMPNRSLVYQLGLKRGPVAILAAAAGPEVAVARSRGFAPIDAIDIESDIFEMVAERYDTRHNPYRDRAVRQLEADGRAAMMRAPDAHYQIIHLLNGNLFGAAGRMTSAWSPSLLMTKEAIATYLDKIHPDGVISLTGLTHTRWLTVAAEAVLRERGVADPYRHMVYIAGGHEVFLLRPRPWTPPERTRLLTALHQTGPPRLMVDPMRAPQNLVQRLQQMPDPLADMGGTAHRFPLPPPPPLTDDHPYPDTVARVLAAVRTDRFPEGPLYQTLLGQGLVVLLLGAAYLAAPLLRREERALLGSQLPLIGYVACLGAGYLGVETALMSTLTLFVGHPSVALVTVVAAMLLSSGVGSALTSRTPDAAVMSRLRVALVLVLVLGAAHALLIAPALRTHLLGAPQWARVALAAASVAPLGLVMGCGFPYAMRRAPASVVAWAWAINGWASVAGGLAMLLVTRLSGYSTALLVALSTYAVALALTAAFPRARAQQSVEALAAK